MCTIKYTRTNKPFEATTSLWRTSMKVEDMLNITSDRRILFRNCLERAIAKTALKEQNKYRKEDFFRDAARRVNLLLEAKPWQEWCEDHNVDIFAASTHITMQGITTIRRVLCDDLINEGEIKLECSKDWNIPVFTREDLGLTDQLAPQQAA